MSNRLGTGAPVALIDGSSTAFPQTVAGGRVEEWREELGEGWFNLDGDWIDGDAEYRFRGEYSWRNLTAAQIGLLLQWRNQRQRFVWRPYSDNTVYQFLCRIVELTPAPKDVLACGETVELVVEAVARVASVPIPDNRLVGDYVPHAGII